MTKQSEQTLENTLIDQLQETKLGHAQQLKEARLQQMFAS